MHVIWRSYTQEVGSKNRHLLVVPNELKRLCVCPSCECQTQECCCYFRTLLLKCVPFLAPFVPSPVWRFPRHSLFNSTSVSHLCLRWQCLSFCFLVREVLLCWWLNAWGHPLAGMGVSSQVQMRRPEVLSHHMRDVIGHATLSSIVAAKEYLTEACSAVELKQQANGSRDKGNF